MGAGRENRGQKNEISSCLLRRGQFIEAVHRRAMQELVKAVVLIKPVASVRSPRVCELRLSREHQQDVPFSRRCLDVEEQVSALRGGKTVVAEDQARSFRQAVEGVEQSVALTFVRHHPEARQRLAAVHGPFYSNVMTGSSPAERLRAVEAAVAKAAKLSNRRPEEVTLVAVSKTHPAEAIVSLIEAGQRHFGENRVQEAEAKWPALRQKWPDISLHLIGQLQSNKAEEAVALFDCIHSMDRPSLVAALAKAMEKAGRRPDCLIQVNIGDEPQKGGCRVAELPALIAESRAANLPISGLMAIPPANVEPAPYFALLAKLGRRHGLPWLSMGMSGDFETAVGIGATHVRVGTALFGDRG